MTSLSRMFGDLPTPAIAALIALGAVQLTLQIVAVTDLARRPAVVGGRKWVWAIVAVLGGLIGALVYLVVGRAVPRLAGNDEPHAGGEGASRRALDTLYGPEQRPPS